MSDDPLIDTYDIERFDEVGYSIAVMGRYFLEKGYEPETIAEKMRGNAEIFDQLDSSE